MHVSTLTLLSLTGTVMAIIPPTGVSCLTEPPSDMQKNTHAELAGIEATAASTASSLVTRDTINIDTYVHVVAASTRASDGYLSQDTVNEQISILNEWFSDTGFQYTLKKTDWTVNSNWAYNRDQIGMKRSLRRGSYRSLNLYYITNIGNGNTGFCQYPVTTYTGTDAFYYDGCVLSAWTTPGGVSPSGSTTYTTGKITVHEVGHWNNLIHTFDGNDCSGPGDYVDDTPAEASPAYGCQEGRRSCPGQLGPDPVYNHMDYSDDNCKSEFTPGQIARMRSSYDYYRRYSR